MARSAGAGVARVVSAAPPGGARLVVRGVRDRAKHDTDSLLRPVYAHAKQGASFGHTKIAGRQVLRKGLSPLATTLSTEARCSGAGRDPAARR